MLGKLELGTGVILLLNAAPVILVVSPNLPLRNDQSRQVVTLRPPEAAGEALLLVAIGAVAGVLLEAEVPLARILGNGIATTGRGMEVIIIGEGGEKETRQGTEGMET